MVRRFSGLTCHPSEVRLAEEKRQVEVSEGMTDPHAESVITRTQWGIATELVLSCWWGCDMYFHQNTEVANGIV